MKQEDKDASARNIIIFQPEFTAFGGEERVILALSRKLHSLGLPHLVLCYFDTIDFASYATWPLRVHQLLPKRNPLSKMLSLRRYLQTNYRAGGPIPMLFNIQSAYHAGFAVQVPYHLRIPDTFSLLSCGQDHSFPRKLVHLFRDCAVKRGISRARGFVTNTQKLATEMETLVWTKGNGLLFRRVWRTAGSCPHSPTKPA